MKDTFQAKEIQEMLGIPRQRYDYLANRMNIIPGVVEVEGRGRAHLYSCKNALEFTIAHHLNGIGMGPKTVKNVLSFLSDELDRETRSAVFDPKDTRSFRLVLVFRENQYSVTFFEMHDQEALSWEKILGPYSRRMDAYLVVNLDALKGKVVNYAVN